MLTTSLPTGQSEMPASLRCAQANGIPMIVIAMSTAASSHPAAIQTPPNMIQSRLSSTLVAGMIPATYLYGRARPCRRIEGHCRLGPLRATHALVIRRFQFGPRRAAPSRCQSQARRRVSEFWAKCCISEVFGLVGKASIERTPMAQMLADVSIAKA